MRWVCEATLSSTTQPRDYSMAVSSRPARAAHWSASRTMPPRCRRPPQLSRHGVDAGFPSVPPGDTLGELARLGPTSVLASLHADAEGQFLLPMEQD